MTLPHLPLELWLDIFSYASTVPCALWRARHVSSTWRANIEAYFKKEIISKQVIIWDERDRLMKKEEYISYGLRRRSYAGDFSHYSPNGRIAYFTFSSGRGEDHKKIALVFRPWKSWVNGKWILSEDHVQVSAVLDLLDRTMGINKYWGGGMLLATMDARGMTVEDGAMNHDYDTKEAVRKDADVGIDRGRKTIGFDWRLFMKKLMLHPRMIIKENKTVLPKELGLAPPLDTGDGILKSVAQVRVLIVHTLSFIVAILTYARAIAVALIRKDH